MDGVVSVAATDITDNKTYYSQFNNRVDIAAPGGSYDDYNGDGYYDLIYAYGNDSGVDGSQGTSMAAPRVSAAVAIMYSIDSTMNPLKVDSYIQNGYLTDDIGDTGYDNYFGYGRLNLLKVIQNTYQNIGNELDGYFYTSNSYLDFGLVTSQLDIQLVQVGTPAYSVTSLSAADATGLTYTSSVNENGAGTYTIYIDRATIPDGEYEIRYISI